MKADAEGSHRFVNLIKDFIINEAFVLWCFIVFKIIGPVSDEYNFEPLKFDVAVVEINTVYRCVRRSLQRRCIRKNTF